MNAQLIPVGEAAPDTAMMLPELVRANAMATESRTIALSITVDSQEMFAIAGDELRAISTKRKDMEELRKTLTRPLDDSKSRIMALFRGPDEIMENAEKALRRAMLEFQQTEQKKADAAKRAAEDAARVTRAALEKQEAEAAKNGDVAGIEAARDAIELAEVAPVALPTIAVPKTAGIGTRSNWKHEVVDFKALVVAAGKSAEAGDETLLGYLEANSTAIGGVARSLKGAARIPGVRVYEDKALSVRRT